MLAAVVGRSLVPKLTVLQHHLVGYLDY